MARIRLTQRRVDALAPRRAVNDVRDTQLKGSVAKSGYLVTCLCDLPRGVEA